MKQGEEINIISNIYAYRNIQGSGAVIFYCKKSETAIVFHPIDVRTCTPEELRAIADFKEALDKN